MWTHIAVIRSLARKVHTHIHTHNFGVLDGLSWSREEYVRTEVQNADLSERIWQIKKEATEKGVSFDAQDDARKGEADGLRNLEC